MGAPDNERMEIYVGWTAHEFEIGHPKLETFTQGALRHADQLCSHKDLTFHLRILNGRV